METAEMFAKRAHQSLGRPLEAAEIRFADALEAIYTGGIVDMSDVARALTEKGVVAPISGKTTWDIALFEQELSAINASLDQAYGLGRSA